MRARWKRGAQIGATVPIIEAHSADSLISVCYFTERRAVGDPGRNVLSASVKTSGEHSHG